MKIIGNVTTGICGIIFDVDNTVYQRSDEYLATGSQVELVEVSRILGLDIESVKALIASKRQEIVSRLNRKVALTETILELGLTRKQWDDLRCRAWAPAGWIDPDPKMSALIKHLADRFMVCFGTNSPSSVGEEIIELIGIRSLVPKILVFGPDNIGFSKPDLRFFELIAQVMGLDPAGCISIGDREFSDGPPALAAGYAGAIIVPGSRDETITVCECLLDGALGTQLRLKGGVTV